MFFVSQIAYAQLSLQHDRRICHLEDHAGYLVAHAVVLLVLG